MERLTTNKKVSEMEMVELAHNCCYEDEEHNARYRDFEMEMDARDFARNLMVTLTKDELPCKVGDHIYIIKPYGIEEASITGISEADDIDCFCFKVYIDPDYHEIIALEEFKDTWFLSREEAEAKLKEDAQLKKLK